MAFNNQLFHTALQARMSQDNLSLRVAAQQTGLSLATLGRLMRGKSPDLATFADWTDLEERADFLTQLWTFCARSKSLTFR